MRNDHSAAGKFQQRFFQSTQCFNVQVVRRFVKEKNVAAGKKRFGHVETSAFTARERSDDLLLISALEVEAAEISTARHLKLTDFQNVQTVGNRFPNGLVVRERFSGLRNRAEFDGRSDIDFTGIRSFFTGDHLEERGLTGAVRTDHADDGSGRNGEAQIIDQETIAETLRNILEFDDFIAEAVSHRDEDFVGFVALLVFVARHFFEAVQTSLALGLSALGILTNPFKLVLHCLDAGVFFLLLEL